MGAMIGWLLLWLCMPGAGGGNAQAATPVADLDSLVQEA